MSALHIALYGKGGAGTTTVASNMSVALAEAGLNVVQVGFDPGNDSTGVLRANWKVKTLLDAVLEGGDAAYQDAVVTGYKGILCIETGLPSNNSICTDDHSLAVIDLLKGRSFVESHNPDLVIYDLSGESFCSGSVVSLMGELAEQVYFVSSADLRSLFAANNMFRAISGQVPSSLHFGGIIANNLTSTFSESIITDFAGKTGTKVVGSIPRSLVVMQCSLYNQSVIEASPRSGVAFNYRSLTRHIMNDANFPIPQPMSHEKMLQWAREWGDIILELETGVIGRGGGI